MKFLLLFTIAAFVGSVHCDQECFRTVFKECVKEPVPQERMELCYEIKQQIICVSEKARECQMPFKSDAVGLYRGVELACTVPGHFDKDKACYMRAINDSVCVEPINEVMRDLKTTEDFIRANKKICNLFGSYSNCVQKNVEKNCHGTTLSINLFKDIFKPHFGLSKSLCEELIIPADENDNRPDNYGMINVFASLVAIFGSA
ncbi:unnamed protein product [Larinioides sclopetarius]|uniref:Uncharacterized protein n=1 Tax=Larinioides sclopetarius TaxID=280406 RepID=A0AAV2BLK7_9ARAC